MEALEEVVEERVLPRVPAAYICRMKAVSKGWQDLIQSSRFVVSWHKQQQLSLAAVPTVVAFNFDKEIFRGSPFNNTENFKESFDWVKIETSPQWKDWGRLEAGAGGLLLFRKHDMTVVNPLTGEYRVLPSTGVKVLCSSEALYMGMSEDSSAYVVCWVTSDRFTGGMLHCDGSIIHVYSSKLGQWRSMTMPKGWFQISKLGEIVGTSTLYQLFSKASDGVNITGLFVFNLEEMQFELKESWPFDQRMRSQTQAFACHGRTNMVYCNTRWNDDPGPKVYTTSLWDMRASHPEQPVAVVNQFCHVIHYKDSVFFVDEWSFSVTLFNLRTGTTTDTISFNKRPMHKMVLFTPSLYDSP